MGIEAVFKGIPLILDAVDQWDETKLRQVISEEPSSLRFLPIWAYDQRADERTRNAAESYLMRLLHLSRLLSPEEELRHTVALVAATSLREIRAKVPWVALWKVIASRSASFQQRSVAAKLWRKSLIGL